MAHEPPRSVLALLGRVAPDTILDFCPLSKGVLFVDRTGAVGTATTQGLDLGSIFAPPASRDLLAARFSHCPGLVTVEDFSTSDLPPILASERATASTSRILRIDRRLVVGLPLTPWGTASSCNLHPPPSVLT